MKELLIDNEAVAGEISDFLRKEFSDRGKKTAILGMSGGIDSAVTAYLCKKAGLDLYAVILPYRGQDTEDAMRVITALGLSDDRVITINIGKATDAQIEELQKTVELDMVDKGNIMARQRMISQYALARRFNGLVAGTENLSEYYLGYFTLFGDQACDISPIAGLWKTQVWELGRYLNVPREIIEKAPSANLWPGQTDEKEFGFEYNDADKIMYLSILEKMSEEEIAKNGFGRELVSNVLKRVAAVAYKRSSAPKMLFK